MKSQNTFQTDGYLLVQGIVDPRDFYSYLQGLEKQGEGSLDNKIHGARTFYREKRCEELLEDLRPVIECHTGIKLYKTYSFARLYLMDNILRSHKDRGACEISVTLSLGTSGEPWPIWVLDKDERAIPFVLEPGDALIYRGFDITHWRERNIFGPCAQVFLHYVDQDGPFAIHRDDKAKSRFYSYNLPILKKKIRISVERDYSVKK
jgi:hypothetical protein